MDAATAPQMQRPRLFALATAIEWARLERNLRLPVDAVRADHAARLRRALADSQHVPFWRDHLGATDAVRSVEDLASLPTIDKSALRTVPEDDRLYGVIPPGSRALETSGTSGEPLGVHYSPRGAWWQGVLRLRSQHHRGTRPWARNAGTAFMVTTPRRTPGVLGSIQRARRVDLPLDADPADVADRLLRARPAVISGHPHMVIELGETLAGRFSPKRVTTAGETLTAESRAAIRRLYGVEPLDAYGAAESGMIAWQCAAADLYHVNHEALAVEIVDDHGRPVEPGTMGHVVLTTLWNPLMPFVRYRIGDASAWATRPCRCGSSLPALTELSGRTMNWIIDAEGNRIAPQRMWVSLHLGNAYLEGIDRYRVRQDRTRAVLIEVVAGPWLTGELEARWVDAYRRLLGDVPIELRRVDAFDTRSSEKFEVISSEAEEPT